MNRVNGIFLQNGKAEIKLAPPGVINGMLAGLTAPKENGGGTDNNADAGGAKLGTKYAAVEVVSLQDLVADKTQTEIIDTVNSELNDTPSDTPSSGPSDKPSGENPPPPNPGGYAAGVVNSQSNPGFRNVVASKSPQDFVHRDDQPSTMVLHDVQNFDPVTSRYELFFTDDPEAPTANVFNDNSDGTFKYEVSSAESHLINGDQAQFRGADGIVKAAPLLCDDCSFLEWGAFTTTVNFSNGGKSFQYRDPITGWWVSGDLASSAEIDDLWASKATATYDGHVLGTVINGSRTYDATGDLWMKWEFGNRAGELAISKFDGNRSFGTGPGGLTQVPGANQFGGNLSGSDLNGRATGSFVRGPNGPAQGVIGNWNVSSGNYRATGAFAGTQTGPLTH